MNVKKLIKGMLASLVLGGMVLVPSVQAAKPVIEPQLNEQVFDQIKELHRTQNLTDAEKERILKQAGWTVAKKEKIYLDKEGNQIYPNELGTDAIDAVCLTLSMWATYNDRYPSQWTVYSDWSWDNWSGTTEPYPGSYDVLGIDWQKDVLTYRSNDSGDYYSWPSDLTQRYGGTVIFNVRDNYKDGCWVGLTALKSATSTSTSMKYTHTFNAQNKTTTTTGNTSVTFGKENTGSLGMSYSVNVSEVEAKWDKAAGYSFRTR